MSEARVVMEKSFEDVKQTWSSQDYKLYLKGERASFYLIFHFSVLLWNFEVFLHKSGRVSNFFDC